MIASWCYVQKISCTLAIPWFPQAQVTVPAHVPTVFCLYVIDNSFTILQIFLYMYLSPN